MRKLYVPVHVCQSELYLNGIVGTLCKHYRGSLGQTVAVNDSYYTRQVVYRAIGKLLYGKQGRQFLLYCLKKHQFLGFVRAIWICTVQYLCRV